MKQLSFVGDQVIFAAGRVTITLQKVREDAFTVSAYQGGTLRLSELCGSWPQEWQARTHARGLAVHFLAEVPAVAA